MISKRNVSSIKRPLTTAFNSSQESWRARLLQVAVPVLTALLVLISLLTLLGCCGTQQTIPVFQKVTIPPELLIPAKQLDKFAGSTCDDLVPYAFYAIEQYNQCAADFNAMKDMAR